MKMFFFVLFVVSALTGLSGFIFADHKPDRYILIEHIGITDKPICTLALAEGKSHFPIVSNMPNYLYYKFSLNSILYTKSKNIFLNTKKDKKTYEFGNFKILIVDGDKKITYFIAREDAVKLFNNLYALYNKEKLNTKLPLVVEEELKTRIYY